MNRIILKNCDVKGLSSLIKKSSVQDNFVFMNVRGSEIETTAYNKLASAIKSITANLEDYCAGYTNECGDDLVKIQFTDSTKLCNVLTLNTDNMDVTFYVGSDNYANKMVVGNETVYLTVPAADKEAITFLEIPEQRRFYTFGDQEELRYKLTISGNEFKYLTQLTDINKDARRVIFCINNDSFTVAEIESTDDNVREIVNDIIDSADIEGFTNFEKLYSKKVTCDSFENVANTPYLQCFNKDYWSWIDSDKNYTIELYEGNEEKRTLPRVKFTYTDDRGAKIVTILCSIAFV